MTNFRTVTHYPCCRAFTALAVVLSFVWMLVSAALPLPQLPLPQQSFMANTMISANGGASVAERAMCLCPCCLKPLNGMGNRRCCCAPSHDPSGGIAFSATCDNDSPETTLTASGTPLPLALLPQEVVHSRFPAPVAKMPPHTFLSRTRLTTRTPVPPDAPPRRLPLDSTES